MRAAAVSTSIRRALSPVSCRLSPVACLLSPVSCRLSPVACRLLTDPDGTVHREVQTSGTMTADLLARTDWLSVRAVAQVAQVALESTGVYWRPVLNLLELEPF
jgi:hypothetical protein